MSPAGPRVRSLLLAAAVAVGGGLARGAPPADALAAQRARVLA